MFDANVQRLRERMRGFEHELDELEAALQAQVDEKLEAELRQLLPEAERIFGERMDAGAYRRLVHLLVGLKLDPRDVVPLLTARLYEAGEHHHSLVEHLLQAQNAAEPHRRLELAQAKEAARKKAWQKVFHEVGLDGAGLMDLLGLSPGPELGRVLREIQRVARGETGTLPTLDGKTHSILISRIEAARAKLHRL